MAVVINNAMIEIPPKFAGQPPVNPEGQQLDAEVKPKPNGGTGTGANPPRPPRVPKRVHGAVTLDAGRVGLDAGTIGNEVIAHLDGLVRAKVTLPLEIEAELPDGTRPANEGCVEYADYLTSPRAAS